MKIIVFIAFLMAMHSLQAQDSLARYNLVQLDRICERLDQSNQPQRQLPYAVTMLQRSHQTRLPTNDTPYIQIFSRLGRGYSFLNKDSALWYYQKAIDLQ